MLALLSLAFEVVDHLLGGALGNEVFGEAEGLLLLVLVVFLLMELLFFVILLVQRLKGLPLLFLFLLKLLLVLLVHAGERGVDDCEGQIKQEERPNEDVQSKENNHKQARGHLVVLLGVTPAFQGDVLKGHHKCPKDVVVVCHSVVRVSVHLSAIMVDFWTQVSATQHTLVTQTVFFVNKHAAGLDIDASVFKIA